MKDNSNMKQAIETLRALFKHEQDIVKKQDELLQKYDTIASRSLELICKLLDVIPTGNSQLLRHTANELGEIELTLNEMRGITQPSSQPDTYADKDENYLLEVKAQEVLS